MTRYAANPRGRGNVAPPATYRPGRKLAAMRRRSSSTPVPPVPPMPFQLLTFPIDLTTPGFLDPPDFGAAILNPPPGSFIEAHFLKTADFDQDGEIDLTLAVTNSNPYANLRRYQALTGPSDTTQYVGELEPLQSAGVPDPSSLGLIDKPLLPCTLYAAFYSAGTPPSTGAGLVLVKIYS